MTPYTLYVMSLSPYSDKIRLYLQLKGLAFVEVRENMLNRDQVLKARTGRTMVPVVITPEDEALNESTQITRTLEQRHATPALRPTDPGRRAFDALVEDYADEWLVRGMLASRWHNPGDAERAATIIAADMTCGAPGVDVATARQLFPQGIIATLPAMGATPAALGFLLDDLRGLCRDLDTLFATYRFIGGAEPTVADLALYGQLNQLRRDPTGAAIVSAPALTGLARWFADLERRANREPVTHTHPEAPDAAALVPLAQRIAGSYLTFAVANTRALEEAPKGPLTVELAGGVTFQAARAGYNRKCLQALLAELEEGVAGSGRLVGGDADRAVFAVLARLGSLLSPYPRLAAVAYA